MALGRRRCWWCWCWWCSIRAASLTERAAGLLGPVCAHACVELDWMDLGQPNRIDRSWTGGGRPSNTHTGKPCSSPKAKPRALLRSPNGTTANTMASRFGEASLLGRVCVVWTQERERGYRTTGGLKRLCPESHVSICADAAGSINRPSGVPFRSILFDRSRDRSEPAMRRPAGRSMIEDSLSRPASLSARTIGEARVSQSVAKAAIDPCPPPIRKSPSSLDRLTD